MKPQCYYPQNHHPGDSKHKEEKNSSCQFLEYDEETPVYETPHGHYCLFHFPAEEKDKLLYEQERQEFQQIPGSIIKDGYDDTGIKVLDPVDFRNCNLRDVNFSGAAFKKLSSLSKGITSVLS